MKLGIVLTALLGVAIWGQSAHAAYDDGVRAYFAGRYQEAWREFEPLAANDDLYAQLYVGLMYYRGCGVVRDYTAARRWLWRPAEHDIGAAPAVLARLYERGLGGERDYAEAARWYRRAAEGGSAVAQYKLGTLYRDGRGVGQDRAQAIAWLRRAAQQGSAAAQMALAGMLAAAGSGPELSEAQHWLALARRQGIGPGALYLIDM